MMISFRNSVRFDLAPERAIKKSSLNCVFFALGVAAVLLRCRPLLLVFYTFL